MILFEYRLMAAGGTKIKRARQKISREVLFPVVSVRAEEIGGCGVGWTPIGVAAGDRICFPIHAQPKFAFEAACLNDTA